jgi:hypothetical protein
MSSDGKLASESEDSIDDQDEEGEEPSDEKLQVSDA